MLGRTYRTTFLAALAAALIVAAPAYADGADGATATKEAAPAATKADAKPSEAAPTTEAKPSEAKPVAPPSTDTKPDTKPTPTPSTETKPETKPTTEQPTTEKPATDVPTTETPVTPENPRTPDQPEAPKTCADTPNAPACVPETPAVSPRVQGTGAAPLPFTGPGDVILAIVIALLAGTGGLLFMYGAAGREVLEGLNRRSMNSPSGFKLAYRELLKQQIDER